MLVSQVLKLKVNISCQQAISFRETQRQFVAACNLVSQYIFDHGFILKQRTLQDRLYRKIRADYAMPSFLAQSVIKTVIAEYKTVKTLDTDRLTKKAKKQGWEFDPKTVFEYLQKAIIFHTPFVQYARKFSYSILPDGSVSMLTLHGREKATAHWRVGYFDKFYNGGWEQCSATLHERRGKWYLHIAMQKDVEEFSREHVAHVVGIDRGLRQIITTFDEQKHIHFESGKQIARKRRHFYELRRHLQKKNTKSSKRRIRTIENRENRWMADINHQISKALVSHYGPNTLFVVEDLTDVSFDEKNLKRTKKGKRELRSWAFYDFEQKLVYKALANKSLVLEVSAAYTSQRCPRCGRIHKENRKHDRHLYVCDCCGHQMNDDAVGAENIYLLGTQWVSGLEAPHFEKLS